MEELEILQLAGQELRVPSKVLGVLVLALHALRSPQLSAHRKELEFLADLVERQSHTIIQARWQDKLKMLWRPFIPPPEAFLGTNIYAVMSMLGRIRQ